MCQHPVAGIAIIGIIFNPVTNGGKSVDRMKHFLELLDERGAEYDYRETERGGQAPELAAELSETCDVIVGVGGDGTSYEVINGALHNDPVFMILPYGSGNDSARWEGMFGITDEQMADALVAGRTQEFDYVLCEGKAHFVHAAMGMVVDIVRDFKDPANARKSYYSTLISSIRRSKARRYHIKTPITDKDIFADFVSAQNSRTAGGGMVIAPDTVPADGMVDLMYVEHRSGFRKVLNVIALATGRVARQPNVTIEKTPWVEITPLDGLEWYSFDGELVETGAIRAETGPKTIRMIVP